ncbi:uncharacterized protein SAPINGB_P005738 [Magnusiomyces paraingens]|uniref:Uncharacterized protein n=1 Tax=Magnusiomyces paraingens TaxID=2606893 RepID=A0A5E8C1N9_9ASCO|nr:uncharacterized protein SAPINGB_P005738 [Saprochaete ingens]VVT57523.1 unnamed protein product [Saprochaete ingens]
MSSSQETLFVPVPNNPKKLGWRKSFTKLFRYCCSFSLKNKKSLPRYSKNLKNIIEIESPYTGTTTLVDEENEDEDEKNESFNDSDKYSESNQYLLDKEEPYNHLENNQVTPIKSIEEYSTVSTYENSSSTQSETTEITVCVSPPLLAQPVPLTLQQSSTQPIIPSNEWIAPLSLNKPPFVPQLSPIAEDIEEEMTRWDWPMTKIPFPPFCHDQTSSSPPPPPLEFCSPPLPLDSFNILNWSSTPQSRNYIQLAETTLDKYAEVTILTKRDAIPIPELGPSSRNHYDSLRRQATHSMLVSRDEMIYEKTCDVDQFSELVDIRLADEAQESPEGVATQSYMQLSLTLDKFKTLLARVLEEYTVYIKTTADLAITIKCGKLNIAQLEHRQAYLVALAETGPGPYPGLEGRDSLRRMTMRRSLILSAAEYGAPALHEYSRQCAAIEKQFDWYGNRASQCLDLLDKILKCGMDALCKDSSEVREDPNFM